MQKYGEIHWIRDMTEVTGRSISGSVLKTFCYHVDVYQHMSFTWKWNNSFLKNVP